MPEHNISAVKIGRVKGKDVNGNVVTLERTHPRQLALFQTFVSDEDRYSNTIELYDAVPKYFSNPKLMASLRKDGKFLLALTREFEHKGERYTLHVRPARLIYKNGDQKEYYPSPREELVEEALRKIACDRLKGVYLDDAAGVQFTLYELKKELRERGHDINSVDLVESLKICNLTNISIQTADGKAIIQSPIFPTLLIASREDWLAEPKQAKCYVQFNPLVTACINRITYRQFDYILYMTYKHRLSRWLYKRLAHNYVQAGVLTPYTIRLSTILRDSGSHQSERGKDNRKRVEEALEELKEKRVLIRYEAEILRGQRAKVLDAKYILYPDMDFITEVKRANSRALKLDEVQSKWVPLPE
ncbi:MAG TPA: hypothetical protein VI542_03835 [Candidatus Tectomicrobia bacterium]